MDECTPKLSSSKKMKKLRSSNVGMRLSFDMNTSFNDFKAPDEEDVLEDLTNEDYSGISLENWRLWRHDALMQQHFETASYIGEIVYSLTNNPNDAFWLAQAYSSTGHYARAAFLLQKQDLATRSSACCYLAAKSLVKLGDLNEALDLINSLESTDHVMPSSSLADGGINIEASLQYLRGTIYSSLNNFDQAKVSFIDALNIDVKCYEALDRLISDSLLSPSEELSLLSSLDFEGQLGQKEARLVKLVYSMRLNKTQNAQMLNENKNLLFAELPGLKNSMEMARCEAEILFCQGRFRKCLEVTKKIIKEDRYKLNMMHIHLSCLHELGMSNELFYLSHELVEKEPKESVSWLAVAIYYLSINKISESRRFFSKASIMDPRFGPAWIGFAHTFAIEGEHDQAVSAYTTAARLFPGSHLPDLFLGMQHLQLGNMILAEEYLAAAYNICKTDPLLLNEIGVVAFQQGDLEKAIHYFKETINSVKENNAEPKAWASTWTNLGHAYRKNKDHDEALKAFTESLSLSPKDANTLSAKALIHLILGHQSLAIECLHRALSLSASDTISADLLHQALKENANFKEQFDNILDPENIGVAFKAAPGAIAIYQSEDLEKIVIQADANTNEDAMELLSERSDES